MNLIIMLHVHFYNTSYTTDPDPPKNITVINITCNSLSVQWSPPSDTGGLPITGYTVIVKNDEYKQNISVNTTTADIRNVSPNVRYTVIFRTKSALGISDQFIQKTISTKSHGK